MTLGMRGMYGHIVAKWTNARDGRSRLPDKGVKAGTVSVLDDLGSGRS